MNLPPQKTKIIATIGPSSRSKKVIKSMIRKGMNIARINFTHGDFNEHRKLIKRIKKVSKDLERKVSILGDLPGIKIRVGELENEPMKLKKGEKYILTTKKIIGKNHKIPVNFKEFSELISEGDEITLSDVTSG